MSRSSPTSARTNLSANHNFWLTGIGGFLLGALTMFLVLMLTRRTGDRELPPIDAPRPTAESPAEELTTKP